MIADPDQLGIPCPQCGAPRLYVDNVRRWPGRRIRRRRKCRECGKVIYTIEVWSLSAGRQRDPRAPTK